MDNVLNKKKTTKSMYEANKEKYIFVHNEFRFINFGTAIIMYT